MKLWLLLAGFFILLSFMTTDGFKGDCDTANATPLVCTHLEDELYGKDKSGKDIWGSGNRDPISVSCGDKMKKAWKPHPDMCGTLTGDKFVKCVRRDCLKALRRKGAPGKDCGVKQHKEFCACGSLNASITRDNKDRGDKCRKKEATETELLLKYKKEIEDKCPHICRHTRCRDRINDPHCDRSNKVDENNCDKVPDKLCEGQIIEEMQRRQDMLDNLYNVTTPDGSDYTLQHNNKKCNYELTNSGPTYVHGDGVDQDHYYAAPLMKSINNDITEYDKSKLGEVLDHYEKKDKYFRKYKSSHRGNQVSEMTDFDYSHNPVGEDVSDKQRATNQEVDPCNGPNPPVFENSRVIPVAHEKDIPCSEPLMPWLQDGQLGDDRHYCKKQETPCKKCGVLQEGKIYYGEKDSDFDGPNRVSVGHKKSLHHGMGLG